MEHWKLVIVMVTVFAFSLEIRPMDPFLTAYLTGPRVNSTLSEVSSELTPLRMYFGVFGAFLVFLLADCLRYKPVMIFDGIVGIVAYVSLIDSPSKSRLKVAEVCLSLFTCAEVSYYGYLYAKIRDKRRYQVATGCAKAGMLSGTCVSGFLGQLVVYFNDCDYSTLPYYSLVGMTFAFTCACFLPSVKHNACHHVEDAVAVDCPSEAKYFSKTVILDPDIPKYCSDEKVKPQNIDRKTTVTNLFQRIYEDFKYSYSDLTVLHWSFWYIIGLSGYVQIILYINILYTYTVNASGDKNMLFNGLVESLAAMCAAFSTYNIGKCNVDWAHHGDTFLAFGSLTLGLFMCLCSCLKNIVLVYVMFMCYSTLVQSVFVIVISQIAKRLKDDCYTLVLGFDALLGIVLGMLSSTFLIHIGISIPEQFLVYGCTYAVLGVLYGYAAVIHKKNTSIFIRLF